MIQSFHATISRQPRSGVSGLLLDLSTCRRKVATPFPFGEVEYSGRFREHDGAIDAKLDLGVRPEAELLSNVFRDRHLTSFTDLHAL
jgi:hypothetical protein